MSFLKASTTNSIMNFIVHNNGNLKFEDKIISSMEFKYNQTGPEFVFNFKNGYTKMRKSSSVSDYFHAHKVTFM